jgi:hypothetical protein
MASSELEKLQDHLDQVNNVVTVYLTGKNETQISQELGIPRQRVVGYLNEWRGLIANNEAIRSRAREALAGADQHYSRIISKAYEVVDEAGQNSNLGAKTNALKLIVDIEDKRIKMLREAGMLENKELADELLETERKQEVLEKILKEVVAECSHCKIETMRRLAAVSDEAVVVDHV